MLEAVGNVTGVNQDNAAVVDSQEEVAPETTTDVVEGKVNRVESAEQSDVGGETSPQETLKPAPDEGQIIDVMG